MRWTRCGCPRSGSARWGGSAPDVGVLPPALLLLSSFERAGVVPAACCQLLAPRGHSLHLVTVSLVSRALGLVPSASHTRPAPADSPLPAQVFSQWGVAPHKIQVIPEAVDTELFDPALYEPLPLPLGRLVFGRPRAKYGGVLPKTDSSKRFQKFMQGINWRLRQLLRLGGGASLREEAEAQQAAAGAAGDGSGAAHTAADSDQQQQAGQQQQQNEPFVFLSSFKWEARKGWDVLLRAYLTGDHAKTKGAPAMPCAARSWRGVCTTCASSQVGQVVCRTWAATTREV